MGHPANYIIRKDGRVFIRYQHHGALEHAYVCYLLSGPKYAWRTFLHDADSCECLTPGVEGFAFFDVDAKVLLVEDEFPLGFLRRAYLAILRSLYLAWKVDVAFGGINEVARQAGIEQEDEKYDFFWHHPGPTRLDQIGESATLELENAKCVITARMPGDGWRHYLLGYDHIRVLSFGAELSSVFLSAPSVALPTERETFEKGRDIYGGAILDFTSRQMWVSASNIFDSGYVPAIERQWPGWQVFGNVEGILFHAVVSGCDPERIKIADADALQSWKREISWGDDWEPKSDPEMPTVGQICNEVYAQNRRYLGAP